MEPRPRYSLTTGIPAVRVGWLVARARTAAGLTERSLARATGVSTRTVRRWERARQVPSDGEVQLIARACGRTLADLLPPRDVVEFDASAQFLRVGEASVSVADVRNDAVLSTFVALVRDQRQLDGGDEVVFRRPDLDVLAEALDLDDDELESRLARIAGLDAEQAADVRRRLLRRRLAVPAVGLLAGSWGLARMAERDAVNVVDGRPAVASEVGDEVPSTARERAGGATTAGDTVPASSTSAPVVAETGLAGDGPVDSGLVAPGDSAGASATAITSAMPVSASASMPVAMPASSPAPTATRATATVAATASQPNDAPAQVATATQVVNLDPARRDGSVAIVETAGGAGSPSIADPAAVTPNG